MTPKQVTLTKDLGANRHFLETSTFTADQYEMRCTRHGVLIRRRSDGDTALHPYEMCVVGFGDHKDLDAVAASLNGGQSKR